MCKYLSNVDVKSGTPVKSQVLTDTWIWRPLAAVLSAHLSGQETPDVKDVGLPSIELKSEFRAAPVLLFLLSSADIIKVS